MDGFNVSDPVSGHFNARLSIDGVRSLDLETSRFSAEKGRGSAGSLDIKTGMGDDRWRFGATNFLPGISAKNGLFINKWTPRLTVSGPVARGRAWFHNGFDAFYDVDTIQELPAGENRSRSLTTSNLTRFHVNLNPANILTGSYLLNYIDANGQGLSFLDPMETTIHRRQTFSMATVREQMYLGRGALIETGFAYTRGVRRDNPRGTATYDGVSIAWAVAEHLHDRVGCRTLFATHYHELQDLARERPAVRNLTVAVREVGDRVVFLRKLVQGGASRSYGIEVAKLAGLPAEVLARAREILKNLESMEVDEAGHAALRVEAFVPHVGSQ